MSSDCIATQFIEPYYNIHLWPLLQGDMKVCLPEEVIFLKGKARDKYDF
jgi:hypothetical protein